MTTPGDVFCERHPAAGPVLKGDDVVCLPCERELDGYEGEACPLCRDRTVVGYSQACGGYRYCCNQNCHFYEVQRS